MDTLKLKIDDELLDVINSSGKFKIEFSHFEETEETNELLGLIALSEDTNPDISREYDELMEEMKNEFEKGNYCFYPTFEWELNEEWWYKWAVYEIVKTN